MHDAWLEKKAKTQMIKETVWFSSSEEEQESQNQAKERQNCLWLDLKIHLRSHQSELPSLSSSLFWMRQGRRDELKMKTEQKKEQEGTKMMIMTRLHSLTKGKQKTWNHQCWMLQVHHLGGRRKQRRRTQMSSKQGWKSRMRKKNTTMSKRRERTEKEKRKWVSGASNPVSNLAFPVWRVDQLSGWMNPQYDLQSRTIWLVAKKEEKEEEEEEEEEMDVDACGWWSACCSSNLSGKLIKMRLDGSNEFLVLLCFPMVRKCSNDVLRITQQRDARPRSCNTHKQEQQAKNDENENNDEEVIRERWKRYIQSKIQTWICVSLRGGNLASSETTFRMISSARFTPCNSLTLLVPWPRPR